MPSYDYECEDCKKTKEVMCPMKDRHNDQVCKCGGKMKKCISAVEHQWTDPCENEVGTVSRTYKDSDGGTRMKNRRR